MENGKGEINREVMNLPERDAKVQEAIEALNGMNPQVYGVFLKFLLLVRIKAGEFEEPSEDIVDYCEENCRFSKTLSIVIQASIDYIKTLEFSSKIDTKDMLLNMASYQEIPTIMKWFDTVLIPHITGGKHKISMENGFLVINDSAYMLKTTKKNQYKPWFEALDEFKSGNASITTTNVLNFYTNELITFKYPNVKPELLINEAEKKIEIKDFQNISKLSFTPYQVMCYTTDPTYLPERLAYHILKLEDIPKYKIGDAYARSYEGQTSINFWFNELSFETMKSVMDKALNDKSTYDIKRIISGRKLHSLKGLCFIEAVVLNNIKRRNKNKPIRKWEITEDELYYYCVGNHLDHFDGASEDPIDFYIGAYAGFDLSEFDIEEFRKRCDYTLEEYESHNGDERRAASATMEEINDLCGELEEFKENPEEFTDESAISFEQTFLRRMLLENQKSIEEASHALDQAKERGSYIIKALK